ncbi:MAG: hypothetical protein OXF79_25635 [Chloroflexi bacterium]|nr:hypothetical protein [Chloroflexota bacterium]
MRLYEQFAEKSFHTSVAATFGIDFDAYESIVLPRLRGAGCRNNIVIPDSRMLTHALEGASALPKHAGQLYTVNGASAQGVFHPKLFLQFGRRGGRLIVSSANLTASGLAGNLELVGALACEETDTGEQQLIAQAWDYVSRLIDDRQQGTTGQRDWMLARTPWLQRATSASGPIGLADGTLAALLTTDGPAGIGVRFAEMVQGPVRRLIVISPYWDMNLAALKLLVGRLNPAEISVLLDPDCKVFPKHALSGLPPLRLHSLGDFRKGRFIHAKAIIAQTANADHVLIGSANCTKHALGADGFAPTNEEVCLYRRLLPNTLPDALGIDELLDDGPEIDADSLDEPEFDDELPLEELARMSPGQFECRIDTLIWYPPANAQPLNCEIELVDQQKRVIPCNLSPMAGSGKRALQYEISETSERPAFARIVHHDGTKSPVAVVTLIDRIRAVVRETRSRQVENAFRGLDHETEASLALLEVMDVLEKLETQEDTGRDPHSIPKKRRPESNESDDGHYRVLSYEEFLAGRRLRTAVTYVTDNSLAGSDASMVRGFLNRIVGLAADVDHHDDDDDGYALKTAFDMGDETADAEAAVSAGEEFGTEKDPKRNQQQADLERRRKAARKATKDQLVKATLLYIDRIKARRESSALDNYDVLRLRALLMILCAAAMPCSPSGGGKHDDRSRLSVLAPEKDPHSWPNLMGKLIFALFGGTSPAFRNLCVSNEHDQIPDDFIECWATCYWCIQACLVAPLCQPEHARLERFLNPLLEKVCRFTLPTKEELIGNNVITLMEGMSVHHAGRLGIPPEAVVNGHRSFIREIFRGQT